METNNDFKIWCVNDSKRHNTVPGTALSEISQKWCPKVKDPKTGKTYPVIAALVDNKLKELSYRMYSPHNVEFLGYNSADGRRCYIRSMCFVLQKAVRDLFPDMILVIDHSLPSGLYCELREGTPNEDGHHSTYYLRDEELENLKARMQEIVNADLPFTKSKVLTEDILEVFDKQNQHHKASLLKSIGNLTTSIYTLDGLCDTFYGPLVPSTGFLTLFDISGFSKGFCMQLPSIDDFTKITPMRRQSKIADALNEHSRWCNIVGISGLGDLNHAIQKGYAVKVINVSEALHERKYAEIADQIYLRRGDVKIVFIAGPSSSGKTSSSLRIALQCSVLGLNPKVIELDNYFRNREDTPKDENGEYDFECLGAMDLELLNSQLNDLLAGKEVEIPRFDFRSGSRAKEGKKMKLDEKDILIMEGIHALNPDMTKYVDNKRIFRVYVSALTSLNLDENNNISTSDTRLLRRMVRDNRVRGISPESTIMRWHSVRRGESMNIFPFQENADAIFNSALAFELPMLRYYAEPLLRRILPNSPAYCEAVRLLKFLRYITPLQPQEIEAIPPTSIMREFIGGQTLQL